MFADSTTSCTDLFRLALFACYATLVFFDCMLDWCKIMMDLINGLICLFVYRTGQDGIKLFEGGMRNRTSSPWQQNMWPQGRLTQNQHHPVALWSYAYPSKKLSRYLSGLLRKPKGLVMWALCWTYFTITYTVILVWLIQLKHID